MNYSKVLISIRESLGLSQRKLAGITQQKRTESVIAPSL